MTEYHKNSDGKPQRRRVKHVKHLVKKRKSKRRFGGNSRHGFLFALLLFVSLCFGGWRVWRSDTVQMRFVYMWPYQNEIVTYANKNNIDPFLVAAVIKNESGFKPGAVSPVGAIGMMQIMPETGEWIARQMGLSSYRMQQLYDPKTNIRMGCWYLSELKYEFRGNMVLQMLAYNAGRGNTHLWMSANGWDYEFGKIANIPYEESRGYVASVLHDRDEYYRLYKDKVTLKGE
ncbi:MAG: lytic transglycosylase domain-containing protein [Succiniclasticum sp.]|nr:lytic transglycosylase domain-containing protein [Succiniclasticum sp.]MDY6087663.1 lytic transglycosylase domain-containing protein [Succiniclasticum sp.]